MNREYKHHIEDNDYLVIETTYQLGGQNYGTMKNERRGIYLHFTRKTIEQRDGYTSSQFSLYGDGNCKVFVKELGRKSQKQIDLFHKFVVEHITEFIEAFNGDKSSIFNLIDQYNGS